MKTEIIVILDRSGSMGSIAKEVVGGYQTFVTEQKAAPGEARMTLVQFDDKYELDYQGVPLDTVTGQLNFVPRGMTATYDAVGHTLEQQGKRIADEKWADLVIVNIITDGGENSSKEYTKDRVQTMVKHAEANGWTFLFLAANMDAHAAAQMMGSSAKYAGNFQANAAGATMAYSTMSATASALRTVGDVGLKGLVTK